MNSQIIDELKNTYRNHLITEKGKQHLKHAIELKRQWNEIKNHCPFITRTDKVNIHLFENKLQQKIHKLEIIPVGLNNLCHENVKIFNQNGFKSVFGYNVTACKCNNYVCFEPHSVNKKDEILYDFTRDFNDEKEKYFLELSDAPAYFMLDFIGFDTCVIDFGCSCKMKRSPSIQYITQDDLINLINIKYYFQ